MSNLRAVATMDNSDYINKLRQIDSASEEANKLISQFGSDVDLGNVMRQLQTLSANIETDQVEIRKLSAELKELRAEAEKAYNDGDTAHFEELSRKIYEAVEMQKMYRAEVKENQAGIANILSTTTVSAQSNTEAARQNTNAMLANQSTIVEAGKSITQVTGDMERYNSMMSASAERTREESASMITFRGCLEQLSDAIGSVQGQEQVQSIHSQLEELKGDVISSFETGRIKASEYGDVLNGISVLTSQLSSKSGEVVELLSVTPATLMSLVEAKDKVAQLQEYTPELSNLRQNMDFAEEVGRTILALENLNEQGQVSEEVYDELSSSLRQSQEAVSDAIREANHEINEQSILMQEEVAQRKGGLLEALNGTETYSDKEKALDDVRTIEAEIAEVEEQRLSLSKELTAVNEGSTEWQELSNQEQQLSSYVAELGHMKEQAISFTSAVKDSSQEIAASVSSSVESLGDIPHITIKVDTDAPDITRIEAAFAELDNVRDLNRQGIRELKAEYEAFGKRAAEAFEKGTAAGDREYDACTKQQSAINMLISAREKAIAEANEQYDVLVKLEAQVRQEGEATEQTTVKQVSLRTRLRELKVALMEMEAAGQRGTAEYQALQVEAGRLTDAWRDAGTQAKVLADDQRQLQGVISGLSGVTGGFQAASSAISLFTDQNEDLQKAMLKVQQLMSITQGLQQLQQTLNKDSAFSIVTLNGLKELWNKLTGESADDLNDETAATATNVTAKEAETSAEVTGTAAKTAGKNATVAETTATGASTVSTKLHTAAQTAGAIATKGLSYALKGLKVALVTTGIGALVVLLGELVSWMMKSSEASDKASEALKEQQELMKSGRETYVKASVDIDNYKQKLDSFRGSQSEESKLLKELNGKYGEQMGIHSKLAEWKEVLAERGEAYCKALEKEAIAQQYLNKYVEAYILLQEAKEAHYSGKSWKNLWTGSKKEAEEERAEAVGEAEKKAELLRVQYEEKMAEAQDIRRNHKLNIGADIQDRPTRTTSSKTSTKGDNMAELARIARERARQLAQIESETVDMRIAAMQAGAEKVAAEREREHQKEHDQIVRNADDAVQAEIDRQKREYEARTGKKDWADSKADQTALDTIRRQYAEQAKLAEEKYQRQQLQQQADAMREYLQQNGTFEQQKLAITQEYEQKIAEAQALGKEGQVLSLKAEQSSKLQAVDARAIQTKIDWQSVFGDLTGVLEEQLRDLLNQLRDYTKTADFAKSSAEDKKTIYDAIERIQEQTHGGEGTTNLAQLNQQMRDLGATVTRAQVAEQQRIAAFNDLQSAEEAHKYALANLTTAEQQLAQQDLGTAQIAYQAACDYSKAMDAEMQNLSQSTRTAVQDTKQGLESVASGLQGLASGSLKGAFEGIKNTLGGLDKLNLPGKLGDTVGKMCKALDNLPLAGALLEILDILKDGFSTIIATLIDTVLNAATGIIGDILSGDIITNTLSSLGKGVSNLANTLTFGLTGGINWNGSNGEQVRATQAALADSNERLGKRIDDLSETIKGSRGMLSVNAAKEAKSAQEQMNKNFLGIARAQMGYHGDHHSWEYYFKGFSKEERDWIRQYAPEYADVNTPGGLLQLSPEQMREILANPDVRNRISGTGKGNYGGGVLEKLQAYADQAGKLDELQDQLNESLTTMTFDSMYSSFVDTLMDMDKDAQDFADDFSQYMMKAMLTNKVGEYMQDRLEKWYKQFAGYMESGGTLSDAELADLQKQWDALAEEGIKYRDEVAKATGYGKTSADAQSATSKGVATITEQSAEELNGRFTALQMIGEESKGVLTAIGANITSVIDLHNITNAHLSNILNAQALGNSYLEDMVKYSKTMYLEWGEVIRKIASNTAVI